MDHASPYRFQVFTFDQRIVTRNDRRTMNGTTALTMGSNPMATPWMTVRNCTYFSCSRVNSVLAEAASINDTVVFLKEKLRTLRTIAFQFLYLLVHMCNKLRDFVMHIS